MRVLVVGSGGREHALTRHLGRSPSVSRVAALPGNDAMAKDGVQRIAGTLDKPSLLQAVREAKPDLVVFGPEAPLVAGSADDLRQLGLAVFGPGKDGARLEGSKAWAKEFMERHQIPTAAAAVFSDFSQAAEYISSLSRPPVVKVDGLAGGKGVTVARSQDEAIAAARKALVDGSFGVAGSKIVIEEALQGFEVSLLAVLDGKSYHLLPPIQDHKAVFTGGTGPNTGGMGAYSPVPMVADKLADIERLVVEPALQGLLAEGIDYRGVLYFGLMITPHGPRVLEFNCRFGDPETQALLPRLKGDLGAFLLAAATGDIGINRLEVRPEASVCVVLASKGYPGEFTTGHIITGLESLASRPRISVDHAGTRWDNGVWRTAGGRVLAVTALGSDLAEARALAYDACKEIKFSGVHYREDIAITAISS